MGMIKNKRLSDYHQGVMSKMRKISCREEKRYQQDA
jgi:hypothetical protein